MPSNVQTKTLNYKIGEQEFIGHLAWDESISGKRPGVLVVHEWWGLNDFARGRANALARLGYVAFFTSLIGAFLVLIWLANRYPATNNSLRRSYRGQSR